MFEVQDLRYATLATVSRCGMVWFSEAVVSPEMIIGNYLSKLRFIPLEESEEDIRSMQSKGVSEQEQISPTLQVFSKFSLDKPLTKSTYRKVLKRYIF